MRTWLFLSATCILWALAPQGRAETTLAVQDTGISQATGRAEALSGLSISSLRQSGGPVPFERNATMGVVGRLFGLWYPNRWPVGISASLSAERFSLTDPGPAKSGRTLAMMDLEASVAITGQIVGETGRFAAEGRVGWAYHRSPALTLNAGGATTLSPMVGHGPTITAAMGWVLSDWVSLEGRGSAIPWLFSVDYDGSAVSAARLAASGRVVLGRLIHGHVRWSALVGYEFGANLAQGGGFESERLSHLVNVGVRATLAPPAAFGKASARSSPGQWQPAFKERQPTKMEPPGRILGVVRGGASADTGIGDAPVPGVVIELDATPLARTTADGSFIIERIGPGSVTLRLTAEGWRPLEETINVPSQKDVAVVLVMQTTLATKPAVISGLVRSDEGKPLLAGISITELNLKIKTGADGTFVIRAPAGRYTVNIEAAGFEPQTKTVTVGTGEQTIYNVDLRKAGP